MGGKAALPEETKEPAEHNDLGTPQTSPHIDTAAGDPGPIEIDVVMKNSDRYLGDLLAGREHHADADADQHDDAGQ